jgi:hypothetical protein
MSGYRPFEGESEKGPKMNRFFVVGLAGSFAITSTLSGHPEIKHLPEKGPVTLYPNLPVAALSSSGAMSTTVVQP